MGDTANLLSVHSSPRHRSWCPGLVPICVVHFPLRIILAPTVEFIVFRRHFVFVVDLFLVCCLLLQVKFFFLPKFLRALLHMAVKLVTNSLYIPEVWFATCPGGDH